MQQLQYDKFLLKLWKSKENDKGPAWCYKGDVGYNNIYWMYFLASASYTISCSNIAFRVTRNNESFLS